MDHWTLDEEILFALRTYPAGLTCEEVEDLTGRLHQAVSGNMRHLVERGQMHDSGEKRRLRTFKNAIIWRLGKIPPRYRTRRETI